MNILCDNLSIEIVQVCKSTKIVHHNTVSTLVLKQQPSLVKQSVSRFIQRISDFIFSVGYIGFIRPRLADLYTNIVISASRVDINQQLNLRK